MLTTNQRKQLETAIVEMLLEIRSDYLHEVGGRPAMDYWEQLQNRMRSAARTTQTASEWVTLVARRMRIPSLGKRACQALVELVRLCDESDAHIDALDMVERDSGLLVALARLTVEQRKEAAHHAT